MLPCLQVLQVLDSNARDIYAAAVETGTGLDIDTTSRKRAFMVVDDLEGMLARALKTGAEKSPSRDVLL